MSSRPSSFLDTLSHEEKHGVGKRASSMSNLQLNTDIPVVTISPSHLKNSSEFSHTQLYLNMPNSSSNLSIDRGLSSSPIPWRDASMEVLVSPNDGPQISIEDLELDYSPSDAQNDSPFSDELQFDGMSIHDDRSTSKTITRLKSDSSALPALDKLIDRRFACYGVSPRLSRKAVDLTYQSAGTTSARASRPTCLNCASFTDKDTNNNADPKPLRHMSK